MTPEQERDAWLLVTGATPTEREQPARTYLMLALTALVHERGRTEGMKTRFERHIQDYERMALRTAAAADKAELLDRIEELLAQRKG